MLLKKRFKTFYDRFISLRGEPRVIAAGMAIGVFIGVTPTIPFHTAIILAIGLMFRQHIAAAYLGSWIVSNPLTIPVFYLSQYELGRFVLGMERFHFALSDYSWRAIMALGWEVIVPLLAGGLIMAPFFAVSAYFITRHLLLAIRKGKQP